MRERKLRSGVNWLCALKQNDLKQTDAKEGLGNKSVCGALGDVEHVRRSLLPVCRNSST
jgi:hypothetical protein